MCLLWLSHAPSSLGHHFRSFFQACLFPSTPVWGCCWAQPAALWEHLLHCCLLLSSLAKTWEPIPVLVILSWKPGSLVRMRCWYFLKSCKVARSGAKGGRSSGSTALGVAASQHGGVPAEQKDSRGLVWKVDSISLVSRPLLKAPCCEIRDHALTLLASLPGGDLAREKGREPALNTHQGPSAAPGSSWCMPKEAVSRGHVFAVGSLCKVPMGCVPASCCWGSPRSAAALLQVLLLPPALGRAVQFLPSLQGQPGQFEPSLGQPPEQHRERDKVTGTSAVEQHRLRWLHPQPATTRYQSQQLQWHLHPDTGGQHREQQRQHCQQDVPGRYCTVHRLWAGELGLVMLRAWDVVDIES